MSAGEEGLLVGVIRSGQRPGPPLESLSAENGWVAPASGRCEVRASVLAGSEPA
jgi:hypothetical protein